MKKIFSIAILACLFITVGCQTASKDEFSGQTFSYSSQELFEQEVVTAKNSSIISDELDDHILYIKAAVAYLINFTLRQQKEHLIISLLEIV